MILPPSPNKQNKESMGSSVTTEEEEEELALSGRTLKEGERVLVPTRRPDGTLRKPIRIRAGYVPQDEVAIYQSKGALLRKCNGVEVPPGYDPVLDAKAKTSRSAKRNERKKEKKQQVRDLQVCTPASRRKDFDAALVSLASEEGKNLDSKAAGEVRTEDLVSTEYVGQRSEVVESVAHQMNKLSVCTTPRLSAPPSVSTDSSNPGGPGLDLDKKIRALKKKIRLTEALENVEQDDLKPEQSDKLTKLEGWHKELKLLENRKAPPLS